MSCGSLNIVVLGLSITSSWGNGHATTYRALLRELALRGHKILFLERNVPWYAGARDLANPPYARACLYDSLGELRKKYGRAVRNADVVIVGSYVPDGIEVGEWVIETAEGVKAFYDIDTPVTLSTLADGANAYLAPELIPHYDLYLSFTGGPVLRKLERIYGSPMARALYCSVDPEEYFPHPTRERWILGYMGTYSNDRQPALRELMIEPARRRRTARMVVAGPQYPRSIRWPRNIERIEHLPPVKHRSFYNRQRLTLNLTRADMVEAGYSPSVRLFEAAACARPIISDYWCGLEQFFTPGEEILIARSSSEVLAYLDDLSAPELNAIGRRALERIIAEHTAAHRAAELESYIREALGLPRVRTSVAPALKNAHAV
jgi:spore maturation protein CgeB